MRAFLSVRHAIAFLCLVVVARAITPELMAQVTPELTAQTCLPAPVAPALNPFESKVDSAFKLAVTSGVKCLAAKDTGCQQSTDALNDLSNKALIASGQALQCATGDNSTGGQPLSVEDKKWYAARSSFWLGMYQSLQRQSIAIAAGTYKITDSDRSLFYGFPAQASTVPKQCNKHPEAWVDRPKVKGGKTKTDHSLDATPFSDCDMVTSVIGGVEQGAQSSLPSATIPFLRLFTRAGPDDHPKLAVWAYVRLLGAPQASSTGGVVSAVTDPAGNITSQTFSGIGTSVDFMLGGEYMFMQPHNAGYSASFIFGYGGTTPLTANNLNQAFKAPAFGTVECSTLQGRFSTQFASNKILPGTATNATSPACLVNANSTTSATGATTLTYTPISTIGFSNQDRSSFLGKAVVGIRTIDRFTGPGNSYCGDTDPARGIGPCERGIVDFMIGQDASVTGGAMSHFVFKVDAVHPLPVKSVSFLYLFGSTTIRFHRNTTLSPLVLQSGDVASLTGNGTSAVPNTGVIILPLTQPDRDFYRFGVGVNVNSIFKKLFTSPPASDPNTGK